MAITLLDSFPEARNFDARILATDIDPNMVAEARGATYSTAALEGVSPQVRTKWFRSDGQNWRLPPEVTDLVTIRELNLIGPWPMKGKFQAIFCRNVTIYFDQGTRDALWARFAAALAPGGFLYIGHSERIGGEAGRRFAPAGVTIYRHEGVPS